MTFEEVVKLAGYKTTTYELAYEEYCLAVVLDKEVPVGLFVGDIVKTLSDVRDGFYQAGQALASMRRHISDDGTTCVYFPGIEVAKKEV